MVLGVGTQVLREIVAVLGEQCALNPGGPRVGLRNAELGDELLLAIARDGHGARNASRCPAAFRGGSRPGGYAADGRWERVQARAASTSAPIWAISALAVGKRRSPRSRRPNSRRRWCPERSPSKSITYDSMSSPRPVWT